MPLESIDRIMRACCEGRYAVGYFESWSFESLQGVLDAAEQTRSPVIIGFNGEFLSSKSRRTSERLALYAAIGKAAAETATVPCGLIFNECSDDSRVLEAVDAGFNLVMPAVCGPSDDYMHRTQRIVAYAHPRNVAVEAELGELECGASGHVAGNGHRTDPRLAEQFVQETVDRPLGRQRGKRAYPRQRPTGPRPRPPGRHPQAGRNPLGPPRRNRHHSRNAGRGHPVWAWPR